jgi:hypothetical protein
VHSQTRPPTEVVLVQDGPVPEALAEAIDLIISKSPVPVKPCLGQQPGLGASLDRAGSRGSRNRGPDGC